MMGGSSTGVWDEGKDLKMEPHLKTGILCSLDTDAEKD